ncbi:RsfA family transcriptional regulator [Peribacillus saganii]|uniref:RsfA family transcriptional regulator n=1 Tax=Peribacillus saganii TaxID=2303992 RepID=A0A372LUC8_9BACI|nr:RsfA family transcriptional regulator [Peribacillus saganii]RFU71164.1 RsfA family transcriptional regulator [Peribacillus saganii]
MSIARQDAWTQDEDLLLAEIVLRHIRDGSTQLKAFEETGRQLSRTAAACGFRWNSYVRKQFISGIELAKKQRKELKKQKPAQPQDEDLHVQMDIEVPVQVLEEYNKDKGAEGINIKDIIDYLINLDQQSNTSSEQENRYILEIEALERENVKLKHEIQVLEGQLVSVKENYYNLLKIMDRARNIFGHEEKNQKVKL